MAEYIDKNATVGILEAMSRSADCECIKKRLEKAAKRVNTMPAADVAPVVHGRWIEPACLYYGAKQYECSLCHSDTFWRKHSITVKYPYCPNCGCRMYGGDDE